MDKCGKCGMDIESEAVRTTGSVYHAACFKCEVCKCSLCDISFSTDDQNRLYCPQDYTKRFAAHCSVCKMAIVPKEGQTKVGGNYICLKIVTLESHENLERNQNDFYSLFHS